MYEESSEADKSRTVNDNLIIKQKRNIIFILGILKITKYIYIPEQKMAEED